MIDIKVPSPGESITEVVIARWLFADGDFVEKDMEIAEIESDKATLPLIAVVSGTISILVSEGKTIAVGETVCRINPNNLGDNPITIEQSEPQQTTLITETSKDNKSEEPKHVINKFENVKVSPLAQKLMHEHNLSLEDIISGLRRITRQDVEAVISLPKQEDSPKKEDMVYQPHNSWGDKSRKQTIEPMSSLRRKLSERLVSVKNETAMLTTFNEVDMSAVIELRNMYQKEFVEKNGVKVGFMSIFIKAVTTSLKLYPHINAQIHEDNIVYNHFADIGIAVQSAKGLLVPVIKNAESMSLSQIELTIKDFAQKAANNRITLDDLQGGTFTITNGGTFGSLFSTPIINPPQSAILGMHNIVERPVAINRQVVIRPMMYIALSYDHRIIDGKSSVGFLKTVKELVENPIAMLFDGKTPAQKLLEL